MRLGLALFAIAGFVSPGLGLKVLNETPPEAFTLETSLQRAYKNNSELIVAKK